MDRNKRLPLILGGLIALATLVLGLQMVVRPGLSRLRENQTLLAEERQKSELVRQLQDQLARMEPWQRRLSSDQMMEWLVSELTRLARESGVRVIAIQSHPVTHAPEATSVSVSLEIESSYHELGRFLSLVESSPPLILVERIEIKAAAAPAAPRA
ncbi:MAG: type 4a pilus biogenesis protein PilO, partial [Candidatus Omnitrophica bacterium]|nr:type 4a pilus biogenesis protein PilO [Candidatus Omnitrophota bacterium]